MPTLQANSNAPDFTLETDMGEPFKLSAQRGRQVVLFFYPQDDTESCTNENIAFSGLVADFEACNTILVGISPDSVAAHAKFRKKFELKTLLAADPDHEAIKAYGVWGPKKTFGKEYDGLIRTTYLIDTNGTIAGVWNVTRVKGHPETVLDAARALDAK